MRRMETSEAPMRRWIDSHAHLNLFEIGEVEGILARAAEAGVFRIVVPSTGPDDFEITLRLGRQYPERVSTALGIHPHEASCFDAEAGRRLEAGLEEPGVVAIGEIGLDYHYMNSPREDQIAVLERQLDIAIERNLPVILHNRESWEDMAGILKRREGRLRGVCHSFTESPERVGIVEAMGLYVGVSGMVTFRQAGNIREMATAISPERLLVETDSPFLAPVPHRGRKNEPALLRFVGERLAEVMGMDVYETARISRRNTCRLFGIED